MSADEVSFRRALPSQAEAARGLIVRSMGHWDHPPGYLEEAAKLSNLSAEDLRRDDAWMVLVDDAVVGFYRLTRADDSAEIEEFHLEPSVIGRGIGRRMFDHATERAGTSGARWLVWSTDAHSLGFYLRMGGEITGTEPSGIDGEEPLTCMRLQLQAARSARTSSSLRRRIGLAPRARIPPGGPCHESTGGQVTPPSSGQRRDRWNPGTGWCARAW